jgi:hypothetical protein
MTRRGVMGLFAGVTLTTLAGCSFTGQQSYRFKMTIEVETPQGIKAGSSVMEIVAYKESFVIGDRGGGHSGLGGEAVVVDLPDGPIFALLTIRDGGPNLHSEVTKALAPETSSGNFDDYLAAVRKLGGWFGGAKADLPRESWPMMVRFANLNDPKTVQMVEPEAVGVKRVWVETTSDAVTNGIEKRLGWLPTHHGVLVSDPNSQELDRTHPERNINQDAFWNGISK